MSPGKEGELPSYIIEWDGSEKFYNYIQWLDFIIDHILRPHNHVLNGKVSWQGDAHDDQGIIHVINNIISITYQLDEEDEDADDGDNVDVVEGDDDQWEDVDEQEGDGKCDDGCKLKRSGSRGRLHKHIHTHVAHDDENVNENQDDRQDLNINLDVPLSLTTSLMEILLDMKRRNVSDNLDEAFSVAQVIISILSK